jgi:hypothetical protein
VDGVGDGDVGDVGDEEAEVGDDRAAGVDAADVSWLGPSVEHPAISRAPTRIAAMPDPCLANGLLFLCGVGQTLAGS